MNTLFGFSNYQWILASPIKEEEKIEIHNYFLNKWKGLKEIGNGSTATIYSYKSLAIKAFKKDASNKRDFPILEKVHHLDYFPDLYYGVKSTGWNEEWEYIVMERVSGQNLWDCFQKINIDTLKEIITKAFYQTIELGYMLNDIIMENIMMSEDKIKVVDVGAFIRVSPDQMNYNTLINNQYNYILKALNIT